MLAINFVNDMELVILVLLEGDDEIEAYRHPQCSGRRNNLDTLCNRINDSDAVALSGRIASRNSGTISPIRRPAKAPTAIQQ